MDNTSLRLSRTRKVCLDNSYRSGWEIKHSLESKNKEELYFNSYLFTYSKIIMQPKVQNKTNTLMIKILATVTASHTAQCSLNSIMKKLDMLEHRGIHLGSETWTPAACFFCFFLLCNNVLQSVKAVFTGSGCDTDDNGSHSAFRAHKIHTLYKFSLFQFQHFNKKTNFCQ